MIVTIAIMMISGYPSGARGDYLEDVGFTSLSGMLGGNPPDGTGVIAMHVEAPLSSGAWMPDPLDTKFQGKTLYDMSGAGGIYSSHATSVGRLYYGSSAMASGIDHVYCYSVANWVDAGFLRATELGQPHTTEARVGNHSWIGSSSSYTSHIMRRTDWVVHRDEFVQVAATCTSASPLMGAAFNGIAVGRTMGEAGTGTGAVDTDYSFGRPVPHIVTPFSYLSSATPPVAAASAMLIEVGHSEPGLSGDPAGNYTTNREGKRIYNAERSEVVKAILMAGSERFTKNSTSWDISDYRADPGFCTENGLDMRYGAGQLNVRNSYAILTGGEGNSKEDLAATNGAVGMEGFDYDPYFGGDGNSNETASYYFIADGNHSRLSASLVWHIAIDGGTRFFFAGSADLYDLDLLLFDVTDPGTPVYKAGSTSGGINNENLWVVLEPGRTYCMEVRKGTGQSDFLWDYSLAWQVRRDGDRDDVPDYWEVVHELNPDDPTDGLADPDLDTLTNLEEYSYGTSPRESDSDDDGFDDAIEIAGGFDPLNPASHPPLDIPAQGYMGLISVFGILFSMGLFMGANGIPKSDG